MHYTRHVFVCVNQKDSGKKCCADVGGLPYVQYLKDKLIQLDAHGPGRIRVSQSGCLGRCVQGPCLVVYPEGVWYTYESVSDLDEIIEMHLMKGVLVERLLLT